jgi:multifunctional 2-oxoglutarate metabolism enzyme
VSSQTSSGPLAGFGPNEWLVDEIYQQYLRDKSSVDPAWWDFFEDYQPADVTLPKPPKPAGDGEADTLEPLPETTPPPEASAAAPAAPPEAPAAPPAAPAPAPAAPTNGQATAPAAPAAPPATPPVTTPAAPAPAAAPPAPPAAAAAPPTADAVEEVQLRGPAARVVENMEASLTVPTATSVRAVPAKLLIDNRTVLNNHLARSRGGKVSFTHLIGWAVVQAVRAMPEMNQGFAEIEGKPFVRRPAHVNLGLAIDLTKPDGTRQLLVPNIKHADTMDFSQFWASYEDIVRKARHGRLAVEDFQGTTISLTNPGTLGTVHSVPRLVAGQGCIVGVGAMEYPAEYAGASPDTLARLAVSKIMTLTSTYDHRIIQGAQSGQFLGKIHELLLADAFWDEVFASLRVPYEPIRWAQDVQTSHDDDVNKVARVQEVIHAYRVRGHLMADTDPLEYRQRKHPDLDVTRHGLTLWDLDREFPTGGFGGKPFARLRAILGVLRDSYCRTVGIEYMHIQDPDQREWIQDRVERPYERIDSTEQLRILRRLNAAEAFETFLQTKYVGQKRFSLEGGETVVALLDAVLAKAAAAGIDEVSIGMPHRGRLNVLANIVGKSYGQIFREFEGNIDPGSAHGSGDVKYHLGAEGVYRSEDGTSTKVSLVSNPSHLEAVDPVLEGFVRAKQDVLNRGEEFPVLPLLLHGDAAFAGQGVVAETLELSQLKGYRTGGTIHVIVNNQVGFTTSPAASRSSTYATDVARTIQAPIFHVNGDDPEACVRVARLAFDFRQEFAKDVVIDMICYRRRGHNEADDPSLTQPLMYELIDNKRSVRKLYTEGLIGRGDITVEDAEQALRDYQAQLEKVFQETRAAADGAEPYDPDDQLEREGQAQLAPQRPSSEVATAITRDVVDRVVASQLTMPEGFTVHPRLAPQLKRRAQMVEDDAIDFGMGEALAIGSLLTEGVAVRLAGQDSRRGTFGHRHIVIVDAKTGWQYKPLKQLYDKGGKLYVYDSPLSEFAAMGFEYGYSVARPDALVLWEAQFGDFANGAQTIIDEFISSGEQKWGQHSSVVLLLPHGYEGQGPDHSSARIERFLQLCAQDNMTIAMPSTPASYFHLLRWQVHSALHRPLVVFTPKSLLRSKLAASATSDFTEGYFRAVQPDTTADPAAVRTALLCSGKVYYDLDAGRRERERGDVAILRMERLYPLPTRTLPEALAAYPNLQEVRWVQEEPANQGAWPFMALNLPEVIGRPLTRVSRDPSSSPAVGSHHRHEQEQRGLVDQALA